MEKETIRDFYGWILGTIETASNGEQTARDFYGRILGTYSPKTNTTRDFYGRIVAQGNTLSALIQQASTKK